MIGVVTKADSAASSSPLSLAPSKESANSKGGASFFELLQGASVKKEIQNGAFVLGLKERGAKELTLKPESAQTPQTQESLLSMLKGVEEQPQLKLNSAITQKISPSELKQLISDAKAYLKDKITQTQLLSKAELESLPKTLKGLMQVAQKLGIEVSKVTLERVQSHAMTKVTQSSENQLQKQKETQSSEKQTKVDEQKVEQNNSKSKESQSSQELTAEKKSTKPLGLKEEISKQELPKQEYDKEQSKQDPKVAQTKTQETPLFKAQTKTEISTEEIVNAKSSVVEAKKPKEKSEDRLTMLLQGERASKSEIASSTLSVATSSVLTQGETPREVSASRGLESLLYGHKEESSSTVKPETMGAIKSESLEVKMNEAKQMMRYLSSDIKAAIEDYKSPFTRVKVQLNPQRLGEVDLTVVQRGKNLHVTLSSNNAAINTLAMNANDLRLQLTNSGIQNATLNFSNTGQDGTASQQQQQQNSHQQQNRASKEYNYFENEEANEEILASLEIVVPSYA